MIPALASPKPEAKHDWKGLEELVAPLQRYLRARCRNAHDAQDVLQETLIRAARYRSPDLEPGRLRSWALSIARNVMRDQGRKRQRSPSVGHEELLFQGLPGREPDPGEADERAPIRVADRMVEMDQLLLYLGAAMGELSSQDRSVLGNYYRAGGSTQAAAAALCLSPSLVKVRLFRARQRLRRRIELCLVRADAGGQPWA